MCEVTILVRINGVGGRTAATRIVGATLPMSVSDADHGDEIASGRLSRQVRVCAWNLCS